MSVDNTLKAVLTVAEYGEFHDLGEYAEVENVNDAIVIYNRYKKKHTNGIPSIGIRVHKEGSTNALDDLQMDIVEGRVISTEMLEYVPQIMNHPKTKVFVRELIRLLPDNEYRGFLAW